MVCEHCWGVSYVRWLDDPSEGREVHYHRVLAEAEREHWPCTVDRRTGQDDDAKSTTKQAEGL